MSKNLTRKGLALVSGSALALTSLVGIAAPANASGEVTLAPSSGAKTGAFTTDSMSLTATVQTAVVTATNLAYRIDNPDQHQLLVTFAGGITAGDIVGYTATGASVAVESFTSSGAIIDFDDDGHDLTSVVFYNLTGVDGSTSISVKLDNSAVTKFSNATGGATELAYGALTSDAKISIQAWVEVSATPNYATVDSSYASDKLDVTFVDPKNVSVISEIVRSKSVGRYDTSLVDVNFIATTNQTIDAATFGEGETFQGVVLAANDRILLPAQTTATQDKIYIVQADSGGNVAPVASTVAEDVAALSGAIVRVSEGTFADNYFSLTGTAGTALAATNITSTPVDNLNQVGDKFLTANVRFSRSDINLNQVDLTNWFIGVDSTQTDDGYALEAIDPRGTTEDWAVADHNVEVVTPAGYSAANRDAYGSIMIRAAVTGDALTANKQYQLRFRQENTSASQFLSTAFTTVQSPTAAATAVKVTSAVTSTTDAKTDGTLRAGTKAFTYRAQAKLTDGTTDAKFANVPVVAVVQAGAYMPTGESIAVTGSTKALTRANESVIVSGLTNADGRFDVTVTSTTAAAAQSYSVTFHIANGGSAGAFVVDASPITATYAAAVPSAVTKTPSIISSSDVSLKVEVADQFGQPISTNARGALNVELKAPDKTKLELFAPVTNGEASFSFKNYLTEGQSDVLSVRVFTGTSTSPTYVTTLDTTVSMFAPVAVSAVNVAPEVTGVVVNYVDFITGKSTTAKPGPSAGSTTYTGTVVNANGAGIAGAAVTISGTGFQFKSGSDFYIDSVTVATDAAGTFSVDMWTTVASATGNKLTVTSGDKTASTLVKSATPTTISPANLSFTWDIPSTLVMNTTYAVTATVTDKWGNPISGAEVLFSGFGSAQFNGAATATRDTAANGKAIAYLRSLKDVDGVSAVGVTLNDLGATTASPALSSVLTDVATTAWDESKWSNTIDAQVNFLKTAPASESADQKLNAGSFNGYVAVYAKGYKGATLSWKIAGVWFKTTIDSDYVVFQRKTAAVGVDVNVELYINGVRPAAFTKTVTTK